MSLLPFKKQKTNPDEYINFTIERITNGEEHLRDDLIRRYQPYIMREVSSFTNIYNNVESADEFSIGLLAFNEAIDKYDSDRSCNFFKYCSLVIRRRISDYKKSVTKDQMVYPFTYFENEDINIEHNINFEYSKQNESYEYLYELRLLKSKLNLFGITIQDLVDYAPKHRDSRKLCINIAKVLADDRLLFEKLDKRGIFPISEILKQVKVSRNTVERNRKFIIASALIIGNGFELLRNFVQV